MRINFPNAKSVLLYQRYISHKAIVSVRRIYGFMKRVYAALFCDLIPFCAGIKYFQCNPASLNSKYSSPYEHAQLAGFPDPSFGIIVYHSTRESAIISSCILLAREGNVRSCC